MRKRGRPKGHEQTAIGLTRKKVKRSNKPVSFLKKYPTDRKRFVA